VNENNNVLYKQCPKCSIIVEKDNETNLRTCINCELKFCWLCLSHIEQDHYSIYNVCGCPGLEKSIYYIILNITYLYYYIITNLFFILDSEELDYILGNKCLKCLWFTKTLLLKFLKSVILIIIFMIIGCSYEFLRCYVRKLEHLRDIKNGVDNKRNSDNQDEDNSNNEIEQARRNNINNINELSNNNAFFVINIYTANNSISNNTHGNNNNTQGINVLNLDSNNNNREGEVNKDNKDVKDINREEDLLTVKDKCIMACLVILGLCIQPIYICIYIVLSIISIFQCGSDNKNV